jgi:hypothetical protein
LWLKEAKQSAGLDLARNPTFRRLELE